MFECIGLDKDMWSITGDVADLQALSKAFQEAKPEIVLHLAAQPIVRELYKNPVMTYQTNVMGTVNVLECVRNSCGVTSFLNVTTDKVYKNWEWEWGFCRRLFYPGLFSGGFAGKGYYCETPPFN